MFRRIASALVALSLTSVVAYGAEASDSTDDSATSGSNEVVTSNVPGSVMTWHPSTRESNRTRPAALPAFYASLAALQLFDGYSTTRALAGGAREANPVMKGVVTRPVVFWSVKAAMAVAPTLAADRMWKRNKAGAIAVMVVSNGMMAAVAAHNAKTLNRVR
jgi:hypothetical protein